MNMGWFPIFANFMEGEEFKGLTPTEKLYFWHLVSRFNKDGEFYQSDLEIAKTLATSEKTIRRARANLVKMGLIEAEPGQLKRNRPFATRYLSVRYATMEEGGFFAQVQRYTFDTMLELLRKAHLQHGDVVVYACLYYWYWRSRGKYEDRDRFFITKKELQSLTNLRDAPTRVPKIYEAFVFFEGGHLFKYQEEYRRFIFKDWTICAEPDEDENNRGNAERRLKEIKAVVASEKRDRQRKLQQKIVKQPKKNSESCLKIMMAMFHPQ
jgi:predicted transcriptional regulator